MSLRGSETTKAISQGVDIPEIATLPSVARNDSRGLRHRLFAEEEKCDVKRGGATINAEEETKTENIPIYGWGVIAAIVICFRPGP
jgi:hypothetical protein